MFTIVASLRKLSRTKQHLDLLSRERFWRESLWDKFRMGGVHERT
jgi:hypothetical protein